MKVSIDNALRALVIVLSAVTIASAQNSDRVPSADEVVTKMMQLDAQRQSELRGYSAIRRYVAVNQKRQAEMLVRVSCDSTGTKHFSILSEQGSGSIRKHVFRKLLDEETEASGRDTRTSTRLTPANYDFQIIGKEALETGPAYVLMAVPKTTNRYLIAGKIWVNAADSSIVRIEGQPARNPSFWVRNVHFVHTYKKVGQFWFAASTHTTSEIRIFGDSELTIENSDYKLNVADDRTAEVRPVASLLR